MGLFDTAEEAATRDWKKPPALLERSGGGVHDSYWRIADCRQSSYESLRMMIREQKLGVIDFGSSRELVCDRMDRFTCGLIQYHRCEIHELQQFVKQRGIAYQKYDDADDLVSKLCEADKKQTFTRMSALPSEIRVLIYEHYCAHFSYEALYAPTQPPLACVSHQVRQDVLPVFYSNAVFGIHGDPYVEGMQNTPVAVNIEIALGGMGYKLHVDEDVSAVLEVAMEERDSDNEDEEDEVDLSQLAQQMIEQEIQSVVASIVERADSKGKLCLGDIYRLD
ncbi:hypothetical protein B0A48_11959 [Cryoendolithus antarcticus]|uniref:Uncharacterized protein n=1 Tax=Cryoendolithus antarcticus TaxID=1507870 RepID=A0A1V8SU81_9PEZI|nr:hypothetical protein B0A48_11959 [Cryoendolithus antarcticus]